MFNSLSASDKSKGCTVAFCKSTDQEDNKTDRLIEYIIFMIQLLFHDGAQTQGTGSISTAISVRPMASS